MDYPTIQISRMIEKLEEIKKEYGDAGVYVLAPGGNEEAGAISVKPSFIDGRVQALVIA